MLDFLPIVAAAFGIPQYLPQIIKLVVTRDAAGVSWSWSALTSLNNGAWLVYFVASGYFTAIVPSSAASLLAGVLAVMLYRRATTGAVVAVSVWATCLVTAYAVAGRIGLGFLLTAASIVQVTPSLWTAYRTKHPTGISRGTWLLVLGELTCWTIFGLYQSDPRLTTLGLTGVTAALLMLARIRSTSGRAAVQSNQRSGGEDEMKRYINCPCGAHIEGENEDDLVAKTQEHLKERHPGHEYSRDEILFMAN